MAQIAKHLWDKAGKQRIPLTGAFELLPTCNLSCKMCYVRKSQAEVKKEGGLLPADFFLHIADESMKMGMLFPLLTGGEPFLRQDFQEIMGGMLERGLQVSINTNGTIISESMAKWLGTHRPIRINITLYGASEDSYEKLCGNGSAFAGVMRSVKWLKQYQVPVKFNTSITRYNVQDLEAMIEYAHSVGSPIEVAAYMFPPFRRDPAMVGENDRLAPEEAGLVKVKGDYLQNSPEWFRGQSIRYSYFVPPTDEMFKKHSEGLGNEMTCRAGRCSFWIDWQGNIGNCGMYSSVKFSLKEYPFAEAWKKVVEETNQVRYSPVCTNCPNFRLCHACIAMVHNECGDINGRPDYLCRMNQAAAHYYQEYAKLLPRENFSEQPVPAPAAPDCGIEEF